MSARRANGIGEEGAKALETAAIGTSTSLKKLDISDNQIYPAGAKAMAATLHLSTSLTSINLANNRLCAVGQSAETLLGDYDVTGIEALSKALSESETIEVLE